jgi:5-methylcytosine-specific restriction enzyme B
VSETDGPHLSAARVRNLSVEELGLSPPGGIAVAGGSGGNGGRSGPPAGDLPTPLPEGDELLEDVRTLLQQFGGVIFVGPPGTSKSHFAARCAMSLAGSAARVRFVQFHASYQYEDFVQGYVPNEDEGGFTLKAKHLLELAEAADGEPNTTYVIVIDELSRGDAARIFGEGLTYVEKTKRGLLFSLASGDECVIPPNLVFLATMNPLDRGVDDVDAAFERRFAKIAMDPSEAILADFLTDAEMGADLAERVARFFHYVNEQAKDNPATALGHTFFLGAKTEDDLRRLWKHQLRFFFEKAYRLDPPGHREVVNQWERIFAPPAPAAPAGDAPAA